MWHPSLVSYSKVKAADKVAVDGKPVGEAEAPRLWRYHKPAGLVTTEREQDRVNVVNYIEEYEVSYFDGNDKEQVNLVARIVDRVEHHHAHHGRADHRVFEIRFPG